MARLSLYLSDDLKGRLECAPHLNLSKIAQKAFEKELAQVGEYQETECIGACHRWCGECDTWEPPNASGT